MTQSNSKVKIIVVDELFVGGSFKTDVWIATKAAYIHGLKKLLKPEEMRRFLNKLEYWATAGFAKFEGKTGKPIRPEGRDREVFRIGTTWSLFRLLGFYADSDASFVVIDAFMKRGRQLSSGNRERIEAVAGVNREETWEKAQ